MIRPLLPMLLGVLCLVSCGDEVAPDVEVPSPAIDAAALLRPQPPQRRIRTLSKVELLSESVTNALIAFGDKIFVRDFDGLAPFFTDEFQGHDPFGYEPDKPERMHLGALRSEATGADLESVGGADWIEALATRIGPWRRVEQSAWKVRGAEFPAPYPPTWGTIEIAAHLVGVTPAGGRELIEISGAATPVRFEDRWQLSELFLDEVTTLRRSEPFYVDVTRAAGVHHEGLRYGQPGNDSDGWNGLACADVNGDGRWDLMVPGGQRNFLYLAQPDGGYREEALARGIEGPGGGTGAVFFDVDNDGDQDLCVAHVGWKEYDRSPGGEPIRLYRNDGEGRFTDVSRAFGLSEQRFTAFSLSVLDYDQDGWLDLFVASYGRMEVRSNDNWIEASNGAPDALLRNVDGRGFQDVSRSAGIGGGSWSYSSAVADYDEDGDLDIYVGTNFGSNRLWQNQGDGTFQDVAVSLGAAQRGLTMGVQWGDLNADGRLDLFLSNPSSNTGRRILARFEGEQRSSLQDELARLAAGNAVLLSGDKGFEVLEDAGGAAHAGWAWGSAIADLDLDGYVDLACANGFVTGDLPQDT